MNTTHDPHAQKANSTNSIEPLMVTETDACRVLRLGRTTVFHLRTGGLIKSVLVKTRKGNIGGRRMYPMDSLREYVAGLQSPNLSNGEKPAKGGAQ